MAKEHKNNLEIMRHTLAHILMQALARFYGAIPGVGPTIEDGFYHDFDAEHQVSNEDLPKIEKEMKKIIKENLTIKEKIMPLSEGIKLLKKKGYKYTLEFAYDLKKKGEKDITFYEQGEFINMCKGPHLKITGGIKLDSFKLTKIAGAYWQGDEKNKMLTRIYGIAFENKEKLEDYLKMLAEAEKRDHRKLGEKLDLFSFHEIAPGAVFWHPKGMIILNELMNYIRELQKEKGYLETLTPILFKKKLYEVSGHWEHYRENIFPLKIDKEVYVLKPMNCPGAVHIYFSKIRSYKDLPLRFSEFGNLHRQERSGTLSGLFRVYGFIQDDAHIFCRPDQILGEIKEVLNLLTTIHKTFKLKTYTALATKPDKAMGDPKLWQEAEKALKAALQKSKLKYELRPKDGAFYGPKIDIDVLDSLGRKWTVATIQLDFQVPEKFKLEYIDKEGKKQRPVIIHRSSIGSFERFIGILIEHTAGALPLWLAPAQVQIISVGKSHIKHCQNLAQKFGESGIRSEVDDSDETVSNKIRKAAQEKIPYMVVIGDKEVASGKLAIRDRGNQETREVDKNAFIAEIKKKIAGKE